MKNIAISTSKKSLILGILIMLIIINFTVIVNGNSLEIEVYDSVKIENKNIYVSAKIITVDDDGEADFENISDALNNSDSGDTIIVYSGTYREHVKIYDSIILEGVERDGGGQPIIDAGGKGDAIRIIANGCTVRGFYVKNSLDTYDAGVEAYSYNNVIENNTIENCFDGIALLISSNNIICNNTVFSIKCRGIHIIEGANNSVLDNNISHCDYGIGLWRYSDYNIISRNTIMYINEQAIWIECQSIWNVFSENNIIKNHWGIWLGAFANFNTIEHNNFINNNRSANFWRSFRNRWNENYWGRSRILPKIIIGSIGPVAGIVPWINIDWNPLKNPYDI